MQIFTEPPGHTHTHKQSHAVLATRRRSLLLTQLPSFPPSFSQLQTPPSSPTQQETPASFDCIALFLLKYMIGKVKPVFCDVVVVVVLCNSGWSWICYGHEVGFQLTMIHLHPPPKQWQMLEWCASIQASSTVFKGLCHLRKKDNPKAQRVTNCSFLPVSSKLCFLLYP